MIVLTIGKATLGEGVGKWKLILGAAQSHESDTDAVGVMYPAATLHSQMYVLGLPGPWITT